MNQPTKEHIDDILTAYLDALSDGLEDLNSGYGSDPKAYFAALERQKMLTESAGHAAAALETFIAIGEMLKAK